MRLRTKLTTLIALASVVPILGATLVGRELVRRSTKEEFDKLVLRSNYNDRLRPGRGSYNVRAAYIRDEVIRALHRDMGCLAGYGAWFLVYINADFKGLYNVVERLEGLGRLTGDSCWEPDPLLRELAGKGETLASLNQS